MRKLLVCDKRGDIQSLFRRRFAQDEISIESVHCMATFLDKVERDAYDIIVGKTFTTASMFFASICRRSAIVRAR